MKPLSPNILIQGRYLIVHLIGKGGMGEVYLAVDQRLGSAVALKRTFYSDDEMLATAFEREARILANLRHPILPKVSDHFVDGENQFLVMEHITGDDLSKRLEKMQQPFPLSWVLFWADQLLDALHFLHTHEPPIIHRDIKPQNLKLTNDNHIVLLDFGLSKNSIGETRTSSSGSVVGYTPHYAPMEQIRGTGTNAQSDLYSLSATVYQLITNSVPPDALTRADSLLSGLPDPIKPINELNKEVTPEVSSVILKGMDIRQDSRPASAREMQKNLRDAYSKLQSAMTAQTVAFNVNEKDSDLVDRSSESDIPSDPLPEARSGSGDLAFEAAAQQGNSLGLSNDQHPDKSFANSETTSDERPSDIKTEVLLAGASPAIKAAQEGSEIPDDSNPMTESEADSEVESFQTADEFQVEDPFVTAESVSNGESFSSSPADVLNSRHEEAESGFEIEDDAFEGVGGHGETAFFASIEVDEERGDGTPTLGGEEETELDEFAVVSEPQPLPLAKKSSGGKKIVIIVGLLAVLFLLAGGVGGVGWFMYQAGYFEGQASPSPSPEPTLEVTPSVEPTVENVSGEDNTNAVVEETNVNSNSEINGNVNTRPGGIIIQPTARPTTTVRPVITPPGVKPTDKPPVTPKKTPTPGGILQ